MSIFIAVKFSKDPAISSRERKKQLNVDWLITQLSRHVQLCFDQSALSCLFRARDEMAESLLNLTLPCFNGIAKFLLQVYSELS